jgi:hypothetical protein
MLSAGKSTQTDLYGFRLYFEKTKEVRSVTYI